MNQIEFERRALLFLELLFDDLAQVGVRPEAHWDIDHLCYRTSTAAEYDSLKLAFEDLGDLLIEAPVNGRLIATFKLQKAIYFRGFVIDLLELPAPKPGKLTPTGFEHMEVVCDVSFTELQDRYPGLNFDRQGLSKDLNRELELCLGPRNVKFHHASLESIIRLEENSRVHEALQDAGVLRDLRSKNPLVVGTFPLGLSLESSDVDVLLAAADLGTLAKDLEQLYGLRPGFFLEHRSVNERPTLICRFTQGGVRFELFAQNQEPVQQDAFRHYLAQERLLKLGGEELRQRVLHLRSAGTKTEAAFCQALKLTGDPFQRMLEVQRLGTGQVRALVSGRGDEKTEGT